MHTNPECLKYFASIIEKSTGIVYAETNYYQLEGRLDELARQFGYATPEEFWGVARERGLNPEQNNRLLDSATNNETSFFRDRKVFDAIEEIFAAQTQEKNVIRIWSAACSTGQEVYSLAITLQEFRTQGRGTSNYSILATDISDRVLAKANSGHYTQLEVQRGLPEPLLKKYFEPFQPKQDGLKEEPRAWKIKQELHQKIDFKRLNLLDAWVHPSKFDVILCRNVLIYQSVENKKKVVQRLHDNLETGGYLILGGAESLTGISEKFEHIPKSGAVVYRKS